MADISLIPQNRIKDLSTTGCNCAGWDDSTSNPSLFNWYACGY